jgi:hypothetical protein
VCAHRFALPSWSNTATVLAGLALPACGFLQAPQYMPAPNATAMAFRGDTTFVAGSSEGAPCIPDVPGALAAVERHGRVLGFHLAGAEPLGGYRRHWQGIQRTGFGGTGHFFISRSGGTAAVVVVRLGSLPDANGRIATDTVATAPPEADRVVARIPFDAGFDHAGGLSLMGTLLAVPMDGRGRSQVAFFEVSDPEAPRRLGELDHSNARPPSSPDEASAVAMTRLSDGRYLLVLGVHSSKIVEFYRSRTTSLDSATTFDQLGILLGLGVGGFQNLALLCQCDGTLFLVGTHNTAIPPPSRGRDHMHWYRLAPGPGAMPRLTEEQEQWIHCDYCNLAAAAGLFITREREVLLYATEFWSRKEGDWVTVEEFGAAPPPARRDPPQGGTGLDSTGRAGSRGGSDLAE